MITIFDVYFAYTACVGCLDFFARLYLFQRTGLTFRLAPGLEVTFWHDIPLRVQVQPQGRPVDVVAALQLCLFLEALLIPLFLITLLASYK